MYKPKIIIEEQVTEAVGRYMSFSNSNKSSIKYQHMMWTVISQWYPGKQLHHNTTSYKVLHREPIENTVQTPDVRIVSLLMLILVPNWGMKKINATSHEINGLLSINLKFSILPKIMANWHILKQHQNCFALPVTSQIKMNAIFL